MEIAVLWNVTPCSLAASYPYFGGTCCNILPDYMTSHQRKQFFFMHITFLNFVQILVMKYCHRTSIS